MYDTQATEFASLRRKTPEELAQDFESLCRNPVLHDVLNAVPAATALLNGERQIVYANDTMLSFLAVADPRSLCGLRPGEALGCIHASERDEGCGTTESCGACGAVIAILASQKGGADATQECRILTRDGAALDLRVTAGPLVVDDELYILLTAFDISHEKRRRALERVFFHDILNTAGALYGFSELLATASPQDDPNLQAMHVISKQLVEEICAQKELLAAENSELSVKVGPIESLGLIRSVGLQYGREQETCTIIIDPASTNVVFASDFILLRRVIANLVKNAVEASHSHDAVTLGCHATPEGVEFRVHNPAAMTRETQLQVFHRSFSTKGAGRGLGTYGAKLLTERFLKGQISFTSSEGKGTVFRAVYPLNLAS